MTRKAFASQDAPAAVGPYSQAVASGDHVFLSGQTPIDPATGALIDADVGSQTRNGLSVRSRGRRRFARGLAFGFRA